jgi:multiple antibiotic resistance protein
MNLGPLVVFCTGLIALINPLANLPPYQGIIDAYPADIQRRVAVRTTMAVIGFMLLAVWGGRYLLSGLRIELAAMQAAGGLILARIAFAMLDPVGKKMAEDERHQTSEEAWGVVAIVPVALPLTVGGGTLAYIIATAMEYPGVVQQLSLSMGCITVGVVVGTIYYFSAPIMRALGPIGTRVVVRVAGVLLMAIALQLMSAGLRSLLPGLS